MQLAKFQNFYRIFSYTNANFSSKIIWISMLLISFLNNLEAQQDLRKDSIFFKNQIKEFGIWLQKTKIDQIANIVYPEIKQDKLILNLESNFESDDSLKVMWDLLQSNYDKSHKNLIGKKLFKTLAFLCDIGPDSLIIQIYGQNKSIAAIKLHYKDYFRIEENYIKVLGRILEMNIDDIKVSKGRNLKLLTKEESVRQITKLISSYLFKFYSEKPSGWYYTINVDTSRTYFSKFTYKVTCIKNEIISDGYYEFIDINIEVFKSLNDVKINIDILGKYGTGLFCPKQREKFYKSMDTDYWGKVNGYTIEITNGIENFLKGG